MSELKPCPFCGKSPEVLQRPDTLDGYFCAISCFCGGYSARAHQFAADKDSPQVAYDKAKTAWNHRYQEPNEPLTLEQLREMDGEPVWIEIIGKPELNCWGYHDEDGVNGYTCFTYDDEYGDIWLAYRRKPESEET